MFDLPKKGRANGQGIDEASRVKFHEITKPKAQRVLGIDPSTRSVAYCLLDGSEIVTVADEELPGSDLYERMQGAYSVAERIVALKPEFVAIESAVYVNNNKTVIKMAYFYGIVMGLLAHNEILFDDVAPITWEAWIDNPPTRRKERNAYKDANPDLSNYMVKKHFRTRRKQKTMDWVAENFDYKTDNDNIADAIAIAAYGQEVLTS